MGAPLCTAHTQQHDNRDTQNRHHTDGQAHQTPRSQPLQATKHTADGTDMHRPANTLSGRRAGLPAVIDGTNRSVQRTSLALAMADRSASRSLLRMADWMDDATCTPPTCAGHTGTKSTRPINQSSSTHRRDVTTAHTSWAQPCAANKRTTRVCPGRGPGHSHPTPRHSSAPKHSTLASLSSLSRRVTAVAMTSGWRFAREMASAFSMRGPRAAASAARTA
jgi:hypothetical protein